MRDRKMVDKQSSCFQKKKWVWKWGDDWSQNSFGTEFRSCSFPLYSFTNANSHGHTHTMSVSHTHACSHAHYLKWLAWERDKMELLNLVSNLKQSFKWIARSGWYISTKILWFGFGIYNTSCCGGLFRVFVVLKLNAATSGHSKNT